ncbi:MAG: hypothetical protein KJS45_09800, partial [Bacteroidetes bacterium]|nr:hypothetical protein [Bacteroidota bacterium]
MPNGNANPLTTCISELQVTISGIANTDTIEFLLTHNVQVISSIPAYSSSAYTGNNGIHKLQWIVAASVDTIKLMLRPISCKAFSDNASLLSSFVSFQCKAIQSLNSAYANYTGNGVTSSNNTVTYLLQNAEVSVLTNPFIGGVSYPSLVNASGNGATLVNRYTAIQWVNTDISDPFYYKFTQETDAIHNGLWAVIPGTDSILLSGVSTGATYTYRLDTFIQNNPNYLLVTGASTKVILLKQQVIRKCTAASSKTIAFAEWICSNCAPNPKTDTVQLNVTVITNTATPQLSFTVSPSSLNCDTSLVYDYRIRIVAPSVIFLDSIIIPIDTSYFTLDAFYLGALNNALLLNNSQYNIQTFGGYTQLRLKLGNLTAPPPGMFNTVAGLSGSYSYFLTDTLYAILKLRFKCDGNNNALKTCTQHQLRLAFGNAAIKYKALCTLLSNPSAPFSSSSIEIHAVSSYTGFIQGFIENTDIDLGASGAMPVGFKFTASDTLQNPFSIQAGQNNLLHCDSVTYYAYLQVPDHITINTFNFKSPDFIIDNNDVSVSTFNGYKHYIIQYGHALQTYNAINNTTYSPAKAHITFDAIYSGGCPFSPATFGIDTMFIQYRAQCGGCENCYRSLACQSVLLFVHCADICGNAVTGTEEVLLQRASFGWATRQEYLSGMVPYQAADLAALLTEAQFHEETHKVYACDSIWLHAQGFTVDTIDIYSLSFELSYMPPGGLAVAENIFNFMHGTATLISTNSTDTLQISLSNPVISIGYAASFDTLLILTFNLLTNQTSDSLLNQHSYHIYLDGWLRVMPPTTLAAGAYFIPQIRGEFVNTNSDPDNFLEHSCDPWGDLMTALIVQVNLQTDLVPVSHATSPSMFNISTPWPMMNACTARTRVGLQIDGGFGINTDDFPFEFRPQVFFETLPTITYPLSNLMMLSGA